MQELNKDQVWQEVLESMKVVVSPATFSTWLSKTHMVALSKVDDNRFNSEIGCSSSIIKSMIEQRYYGLVQDSLVKALGTHCEVIFSVKQPPLPNAPANVETVAPLFQQATPINHEQLATKFVNARLRPFFTFDNFAVSASNQMAWAAAEAVAAKPGSAYTPLFLWGGVGVGKTHLMNAVGISIIEQNPDSKVLLCTGEDFTNDIVEGIRNKTTHAFRDKYRKLKALLIDDIQFIAGKDSVQEEFFHTFNAVTAAGGQIILTSDKPPSDISKLEERLRSRFEAGLIVDISPPDFELRCAIIQIKAKEKNLELPTEVVHIIAGNVEAARKIEGILVRLASEVRLRRSEITQELVKSLLDTTREEMIKKRSLTPDEVVDAVCGHFSINRRALMGKARSRIVARPRQMLMYLLRVDLGLPLEEVGRIVGGRDHTTVMHAVDKIKDLASGDVRISEDLLGIKRKL